MTEWKNTRVRGTTAFASNHELSVGDIVLTRDIGNGVRVTKNASTYGMTSGYSPEYEVVDLPNFMRARVLHTWTFAGDHGLKSGDIVPVRRVYRGFETVIPGTFSGDGGAYELIDDQESGMYPISGDTFISIQRAVENGRYVHIRARARDRMMGSITPGTDYLIQGLDGDRDLLIADDDRDTRPITVNQARFFQLVTDLTTAPGQDSQENPGTVITDDVYNSIIGSIRAGHEVVVQAISSFADTSKGTTYSLLSLNADGLPEYGDDVDDLMGLHRQRAFSHFRVMSGLYGDVSNTTEPIKRGDYVQLSAGLSDEQFDEIVRVMVNAGGWRGTPLQNVSGKFLLLDKRDGEVWTVSYSSLIAGASRKMTYDDIFGTDRDTNEDGFTIWTGGRCPVDIGTLVDVKYRDGKYNYGVGAGCTWDTSGSTPDRCAHDWSSRNRPASIVAYRLHQSEESNTGGTDVGDLPQLTFDDVRYIVAEIRAGRSVTLVCRYDDDAMHQVTKGKRYSVNALDCARDPLITTDSGREKDITSGWYVNFSLERGREPQLHSFEGMTSDDLATLIRQRQEESAEKLSRANEAREELQRRLNDVY
ncbi:hypothetical protein BH688_05655 [Kushneria phosphatilytica]|nr:hypothetical protein BH688_05655 [Kushneria phosphatilytica]